MQVNPLPAVCQIRGFFPISFLNKVRKYLKMLVHSVSSLLLCHQHGCSIPFRNAWVIVVVWRCSREVAMVFPWQLLALWESMKEVNRKGKAVDYLIPVLSFLPIEEVLLGCLCFFIPFCHGNIELENTMKGAVVSTWKGSECGLKLERSPCNEGHDFKVLQNSEGFHLCVLLTLVSLEPIFHLKLGRKWKEQDKSMRNIRGTPALRSIVLFPRQILSKPRLSLEFQLTILPIAFCNKTCGFWAFLCHSAVIA